MDSGHLHWFGQATKIGVAALLDDRESGEGPFAASQSTTSSNQLKFFI